MDFSTTFKNFMAGFVQADPEWLVFDSDMRCTYWQNRIGQTYEIQPSEGGQIHLTSVMAVAIKIRDSERALRLCQALNQFSGSFSFAYSDHLDTLFSVCSLTALPSESQILHRFALASLDQAWFSDRLADLIADEVGGEVNFSYPSSTGRLRETPDVNFFRQTSVRSRPEWATEPLPWEFPIGLDLASYIDEKISNQMIFAEPSLERFQLLHSEDMGSVFSGKEFGSKLDVFWQADFVFGTSFTSELRITQAGAVSAKDANDFIWYMVDSPTGQVLSGVFASELGLCVRSILPSWQLRKMIEDLQPETRAPEFLLEHLQTLRGTHGHAITFGWGPSLSESEYSGESAKPLIWALSNSGQELVDDPTFGQNLSPVNRGLLWVHESERLFEYGFFNPMGPSLGVIFLTSTSESGRQALVHIMRHPVSPQFEVLGHITKEEDLLNLIENALPSVLRSSPTWFQCYESRDFNHSAKRRASFLAALEKSLFEEIVTGNLLKKANRLKAFGGNPWLYASHNPEEHQVPDFFEGIQDPFTAYVNAAEDPNTVSAMLSNLSYAWDGSLNFLETNGSLALEMMDCGPNHLIFSRSIGLP